MYVGQCMYSSTESPSWPQNKSEQCAYKLRDLIGHFKTDYLFVVYLRTIKFLLKICQTYLKFKTFLNMLFFSYFAGNSAFWHHQHAVPVLRT
jgi:hypothetical protein